MMYICNPSPQEIQAWESGVQGKPQLCSEFEASLGYKRPYFQIKTGIIRINSMSRSSYIYHGAVEESAA